MVKLWQIGLLTAILSNIPEAKSNPAIYIIPDDAQCTVRKSDKITYCTDLDGDAITGELRRYQDNNLIRVYPLENGILNGTAITYYKNGKPKTEKPYKEGILNGVVKEYYDNGTLGAETPYINGIKEGIAKSYDSNGTMLSQMIYFDNMLNGEMRIYSPQGKTIYSFENENGQLISGTYYFNNPKFGIDMLEIPDVVIEAINNHCVELQTELSESACAIVFNGPLETCNNEWRKKNRMAVRSYLSECQKGVK